VSNRCLLPFIPTPTATVPVLHMSTSKKSPPNAGTPQEQTSKKMFLRPRHSYLEGSKKEWKYFSRSFFILHLRRVGGVLEGSLADMPTRLNTLTRVRCQDPETHTIQQPVPPRNPLPFRLQQSPRGVVFARESGAGEAGMASIASMPSECYSTRSPLSTLAGWWLLLSRLSNFQLSVTS